MVVSKNNSSQTFLAMTRSFDEDRKLISYLMDPVTRPSLLATTNVKIQSQLDPHRSANLEILEFGTAIILGFKTSCIRLARYNRIELAEFSQLLRGFVE